MKAKTGNFFIHSSSGKSQMKPKITAIIPLGEKRSIEILETIKRQYEKISFIIEKGPNHCLNLNRGVKKAKTEILAFVNGHTLLPRDWSKKVRIFFEKHPEIDIVGGPQLTPENASYFEKISGYALGSRFGSGEASTRYSGRKLILNADETMLTSANLVCRKHVLKLVKFDETLYPGGDPKFISDAKKKGFKIAYSPEIIAYNKRRTNIKDFFIQNFNYGKVRPKKEPFLETLKHPFFIIPSLFILYLILLIPLMIISKFFLFPAIIYICLNIIFSVYEGTKNNNFFAILFLPFIFLTIHLSYGAGFLYGLIFRK